MIGVYRDRPRFFVHWVSVSCHLLFSIAEMNSTCPLNEKYMSIARPRKFWTPFLRGSFPKYKLVCLSSRLLMNLISIFAPFLRGRCCSSFIAFWSWRLEEVWLFEWWTILESPTFLNFTHYVFSRFVGRKHINRIHWSTLIRLRSTIGVKHFCIPCLVWLGVV